MQTHGRSKPHMIAIVLGVVGVASTGAIVDHASRPTLPGPYDAIVVAGCRVRANGEPSAALARRVRRAVELAREHSSTIVVMTGGRGANGFVEADVAAKYAERLGLERTRIERERESTSTEENACFAARLIGRHTRVLLVTDDYHVFRAERVFARHFDSVKSAAARAPIRASAYAFVREVFAVAIYAVVGRL